MSDDAASVADLQTEFARVLVGQDAINNAYYALKIALYRNKPENYISQLISYTGANENSQLDRGDESALFAALVNKEYVELLLDNGEPID